MTAPRRYARRAGPATADRAGAVEGDLEELYMYWYERASSTQATLRYLLNVLSPGPQVERDSETDRAGAVLPPFVRRRKRKEDYSQPLTNLHPDMIRNYLKIAFAALLSNKVVSSIKIGGLALGISLCLVIISIITDQSGYDKFHRDTDRIYRIDTKVFRKNGRIDNYATTAFPVASALKQQSPFVENAIPLSPELKGEALIGGKKSQLKGFFTDQAFFDVFGFEFLFGEKSVALASPNSIVLTQRIAEKYFGLENPIGKTIVIENRGYYQITGVLKNTSGKTHLLFDMLGSNGALSSLEKEGKLTTITTNWKKVYNSYIYVKISDNTKLEQVKNVLNSIQIAQFNGLSINDADKKYEFYLQAFEDIVPGPLLSNNLGKALPIHMIRIFEIFALLIIISSIFNFNSLTIAQALRRAKEIGVRKVNGATRMQLIAQFLTESILVSLIALFIAMIIYQFFLVPSFMTLNLFQEFDIRFKLDYYLITLFFFFGILIGVFSGLFPALYLSSLSVIKTIKDQPLKSVHPKLGYRKVLLIIQFCFAQLFIITSINLYRQYSYVLHEKYGFNTEHIVNLKLQGNDYDRTVRTISALNSVKKVSGISYTMGTGQNEEISVQVNKADEKSIVQQYSIDRNYMDNLNLTLVAGKNFEAYLSGEKEQTILVNEAFINNYTLGSPPEAVGKKIIMADSLSVTIAGIVKDFHFQSFATPIEPLVLRYHPSDITILNVQYEGNSATPLVASLEKIWKTIDKEHTLSYSFFSDDLQNNYKNFRDLNKIFETISLLTVTLAFLGLIGLLLFIIRQKTKEIAIRKVFGASITQISFFLSTDFIKLLLMACVIGIPLSVLLNNKLFQQYAYRVDLLWGYVLGSFILYVLTLCVIGIRIIYAASINPVKSLNVE